MTTIIAFEGINRSGKSTLVTHAAQYLRKQGLSVQVLKFPARQTEIGELIYAHFEGRVQMHTTTLQYLLEANKMELQDKIQLMSDVGVDVILIDRYLLSGLAYGVARGVDPDLIRALQSPLRKPDFTVLFDLPVEVALLRAQLITERDEADLELMRKVRQLYLNEIAADETAVIVDASHDLALVTLLLEHVIYCFMCPVESSNHNFKESIYVNGHDDEVRSEEPTQESLHLPGVDPS
jgi:dTMP kinase